MCDACQAKKEVNELFAGAAGWYGSSALGIAVLSVFINPFLVLTVIAVLLSVQGLLKLTRGPSAEDYRAALGRKRNIHIAACIGAIVITLTVPLLRMGLAILALSK